MARPYACHSTPPAARWLAWRQPGGLLTSPAMWAVLCSENISHCGREHPPSGDKLMAATQNATPMQKYYRRMRPAAGNS